MIPISRNQAPLILSLLELFPAVAILGARQTGKTTLAKQLKPAWKYMDLEQPNDFERISQDPALFFKQFPSHLILDEAQNYPPLFNVLRGVIDHDRELKGRFILTGSSSPALSKHLSESLAGRIAIIELGTLKANEYYQKPLSNFYNIFQNKLTIDTLPRISPQLSQQEMQTVWLKGGYPEPALHHDDFFYQAWMNNYYLNYLNRDIASLFPKLNKIKYQRFIKMLCQLSGTIVNKAELGRALEVDEGTSRQYLSIAEGTFLWREILSYENSPIKSIVKMPKGHIRDSGLLHYLLQIKTLDDLFNNMIVGHSFESFVIEELIKGLNASPIYNWKFYYFRTRKGSEVDFILSGYFGVIPIEIKYTSMVSVTRLRALKDFIQDNHSPFGIVINMSDEWTWLTENIVQIPIGVL